MVRLKECQICGPYGSGEIRQQPRVLAIEMDRGALSGTITLVAAKEDPKKFLPFLVRIMYNALS